MCSPKCSAITFGVLTAIAVLCVAIMTRSYIQDFKRYQDVQPGTCTTVSSYYSHDYRPSCSCNVDEDYDDCYVYYNCLVIEVILDKSGPPPIDINYEETSNYNLTDRDKIIQSVARMANKTELIEEQNVNHHPNALVLYQSEGTKGCSYHPSCSYTHNLDERIAEFNASFGAPGTVFKCLFSPTNTDKVFRNFSSESWYIGSIIVCACLLAGFLGFFIFSCHSMKNPNCIFQKKDNNRQANTEMQIVSANPNQSQQPAAQNQYQPVSQQHAVQQQQYLPGNQYQPQQAGQYALQQPQPGQYAAQPGQYATQPGKYAPQPGQYTPQPGQYAPQPGQYSPDTGPYAPQPGQYAPQPGPYTPQPGQYAQPGYLPPPVGPFEPPPLYEPPDEKSVPPGGAFPPGGQYHQPAAPSAPPDEAGPLPPKV